MGDHERTNVIVVGAGASQEFGLPTGAELTEMIWKLLNYREDNLTGHIEECGSIELRNAISGLAAQRGHQSAPYFAAAKLIRRNMHLAPSIDNFLDTHRNYPELLDVGKLAIADAIIRSEARCSLRIDETNSYNRLWFSGVANTWCSVFFKQIAAKRNFESFISVLGSITFISFNYDRCIEQFFVNAAASYFDLGAEEILRTRAALKIIFPYGSIGDLGIEGQRTSRFGPRSDFHKIVGSASRIKTFTERMDDSDLVEEIKEAVNGAEVVLFLGFSFLDINMNLLEPTGCHAERVLATAKGRSTDTVRRLKEEIATHYVASRNSKDVEMFDGKCFELFWEFDHYLSSVRG